MLANWHTCFHHTPSPAENLGTDMLAPHASEARRERTHQFRHRHLEVDAQVVAVLRTWVHDDVGHDLHGEEALQLKEEQRNHHHRRDDRERRARHGALGEVARHLPEEVEVRQHRARSAVPNRSLPPWQPDSRCGQLAAPLAGDCSSSRPPFPPYGAGRSTRVVPEAGAVDDWRDGDYQAGLFVPPQPTRRSSGRTQLRGAGGDCLTWRAPLAPSLPSLVTGRWSLPSCNVSCRM